MTTKSPVTLIGAAITAVGLSLIAAYIWTSTNRAILPAPLTCLGLTLAGAVLWLGSSLSKRSIRILVVVLAGSVLAIGLISRWESLPGSFNFVLLGVGLLLVNERKAAAVLTREISAVASITFSYFDVVAYLVPAGRMQAPENGEGAFVASLFLAASIGLLLGGREGFLIPLLRDTGPAGVLVRWLMPVPLILPVLANLVRLVGRRANLFPVQTNGSVISSLNILLAILIVWRCSSKLLESDHLRRKAEKELLKSRDDLDRRVELRTAELQLANRQMESEIAERKKVEEDLKNANMTLNTLIDASPLGICTFSSCGQMRQRNAAAVAMLGETQPEFDDLIQRAAQGGRVAGVEVTRPGGKGYPQYLNVWASPLPSAGGSYDDGVLLMIVDVTESKVLEAKMRQTQKLESLGVLAGGIAHDFNNLLTGILGSASLAQLDLAVENPTYLLLQQVVSASQRAAELTRQLLAYAGKGRFVLEQVNISALAREISDLIKTLIPKGVDLHLNLSQDMLPIEADASQIHQVIMNLVINGAEAIPESGVVVVSTGRTELDGSFIEQYLAGENLLLGEYVWLEVHDTGTGMDQETQSRIFDPFFTTKFTGRGLGLAAVQGIVRSHKGALRIYSAPGRGTTFKIFFPVSYSSSQRLSSAARMANVPRRVGRSGTILVIDDELVVGQTAKSTLEHHGFIVELAGNGQDGLKIFAARHDSIGAVLLDLTMPGLSGQETFAALKSIDPRVPIVMSSGFNEIEVVQQFAGKDLAGFVQKPFTSAQLVAKLNETLQTAAAGMSLS
jgi:signal transduction histidine kinase/CheY-like chemotaxis protein